MKFSLSNVLCNLGGVGAALIMGTNTYWWVAEEHLRSDSVWIFLGFSAAAFLVWLVGRACRSVLGGK
jgi:hypothetical protein